MTKYVQTNENGYVTGIVSEPLLIGLFGGAKNYKELTDEQAEAVEPMLKARHRAGEGLHISELKNI